MTTEEFCDVMRERFGTQATQFVKGLVRAAQAECTDGREKLIASLQRRKHEANPQELPS